MLIRSTTELEDPGNLLLSSVLARRQGYCVGIASLYLVLAERLRLPIYAVSSPSHVFLRYDDGTTRINIETFQRGAARTDEEYVREQRIPAASVKNGVFMRNLAPEEFLAQVHNNLGVIYSQRQDFDRAAEEFATALHLSPRIPAAWYNQGRARHEQGDLSGAVRSYSKSLRLYPEDVWALRNRGLAYEKVGKDEKSRADFEAALRIDPAFEPPRKSPN